MIQKEERRPPAGTAPTISTTDKQLDPGQGNPATLFVAYAVLLLSMPGAVYDRLLVKVCPVPECAYSHSHYVPVGAASKGPIIRPPRCRPWLRYRIEVVDVVPAAVVPGQLRQGAA